MENENENEITVRDLAHVLGVEDLSLTVAHREGTWSATVRYQGHPLSGCSEAWCDDNDLERAIVGAIENWRAFVAAEIAEMEADPYEGIDPDLAWKERGERGVYAAVYAGGER